MRCPLGRIREVKSCGQEESMPARDPYRFVNELDDATTQRLINRLESRAKDKLFTRLFDKYATQLNLPPLCTGFESRLWYGCNSSFARTPQRFFRESDWS